MATDQQDLLHLQVGVSHFNQHHHHHKVSHQDRNSQPPAMDFPLPLIEDVPMVNRDLKIETFHDYRLAKRRIQDLRATNLHNDQIILFFVGSIDSRGKMWHTDCNSVDRAITYLLKKLEVGGHFLKIHVGNRNEW
jgi:hypothetical protein